MEIKKKGLKKVEDVEGMYHLAYIEGKERIANAKTFIISALCYLLLFTGLIVIFTIFSGLNFYLIGFELIFILIFFVMFFVGKREKKKGINECLYAVNRSNEWAVVHKKAKEKKVRKSTIKVISTDIEKYGERKTHKQKKANRKKRRIIYKNSKEKGI